MRPLPAPEGDEAMLRILMIVSGWVEAAFGASILTVPILVTRILLATEADASAIALARILGAATLALGIAALLTRNAISRQAQGAAPREFPSTPGTYRRIAALGRLSLRLPALWALALPLKTSVSLRQAE